ncbi:unnamed protein product, partial [Meganyctiphanes norvegica]
MYAFVIRNENKSTAAKSNDSNDIKNRDEPASGSEWSDDDSDISNDEFYNLPEDFHARREEAIWKNVTSDFTSRNEIVTWLKQGNLRNLRIHVEENETDVEPMEIDEGGRDNGEHEARSRQGNESGDGDIEGMEYY